MIRILCFTVLPVVAWLFLANGSAQAQPKKPYEKHDASALNLSLRHVIDVGAKMFNDHGDHAGCYRLYQGSLLAVKPFLSEEFKKKIDAGIAKAETLPFYSDRAFELRRVLDEIRKSTKADGTGNEKQGTKDGATGKSGQVAGTLLFQDKAVTGGYFVTLIGAAGKKYSSAINKDGSFQFKTPIPEGEYRIAIEPIPGEAVKGVALPTRFGSETTSGLSIRVEPGQQQVTLNLVQ
ncbi:MAG: hypothetical protein HYX68_10150 [Planctomycetes bacterium]|jgi:hypothetical protein|nr:hypothetical protein [Planctomycetota bacterium]